MRRLLGALVVLVLVGATGYAQTFRGAINGTVSDPSGAVVAGADVKATEIATGIVHSTITTSGGEFAFQDLSLGAYRVTVTVKGFQQTNVENVNVTAGSVFTVPVKLTMGRETTAVEVSAAALEVDTTTTTQSDTITTRALQDMPLNGRDFSQLIAVTPGYGGYAVGGFGSLNGTRANQMNWQIDGTDNNDFWHNIPAVNQGGVSGIAGVVMPVDAIDEFSAQTQSNAESGRNAGGTVNLAIKSGTNSFHGTGYYYNRNEFYAASSPFFVATPDFPKPPRLRNYNTGFTVGGPIIKDKTFFFFGFEKQNYIFGLTGLSTEPSAAWATNAQALLTANGITPSPLSATLLSTLWPSSIRGLPATLNNYFATVPGTGYSQNGVVKLDHNFTPNEHLSFHFFVGQGSQTQPPGASLALATASSNLGDYFEVAPIHVQNYSLILNSVLTPKLTNQVLFGVSYFNQVFHDANNSFDERALGLFTSPDALINGKPILGAPNIAISGFDQVGITPPEGRNDITGHLTDIVSYTTGRHQFRFGGEVRQGRVDEFYFRRSLGAFNFDGSQGPWAGTCASGDPTCALADFLAGDVVSSSIAVGNAERFVRVNGFDFFGQDNWQITPKLNLNYGLRYEYIGPLHSLNKDLPVFVQGRGLLVQGNGIDSIFPPDKNNFAPRFGFAYQPTGKNDLVVRGGIGVFYDQINMNPFLDFRPPIGGADGLQDNPIGPHPVDNYGANRLGQTSYNWDAIQAGGQSIFSPATTCPTLNCGGTNIYNVYSVNQNFRTPYFYNYNLNIEKGLGNAAVLQIGYVGSAGHKASVMLNINQNGNYSNVVSSLTGLTTNNCPGGVCPYPNVGSILQLNSIGNSNYNSLQTTLRVRTWHGLSAQFGYTWAHALDDMTEYRGQIPLDSFNLKQEWGSGDFDTRNNFTAFWTYDIPGSSHGPKILTHGWQVSSLWSFHSGQPFNFGGINASGTQRPGLNLIADPFAGVNHTFNAASGGEPWVNPAAFCIPGKAGCPGTTNPDGDLGRNAFTGPGFADVDLSVIKNIPVTERLRVQLRAEMFNTFNRKNLASGAGSVNGKGFVGDTIGDFNGAPGLGPGEPFNMQLVGKIIF
ncbi:MAG TPA: TonB-dependent receptor [Terriglobales bacterium]|nr:TonB-dependent receptor [Terriglobales bacterium]